MMRHLIDNYYNMCTLLNFNESFAILSFAILTRNHGKITIASGRFGGKVTISGKV